MLLADLEHVGAVELVGPDWWQLTADGLAAVRTWAASADDPEHGGAT